MPGILSSCHVGGVWGGVGFAPLCPDREPPLSHGSRRQKDSGGWIRSDSRFLQQPKGKFYKGRSPLLLSLREELIVCGRRWALQREGERERDGDGHGGGRGSMSGESKPAEAAQRKASVNKNIKKLRTISAVCGLARSWQRWVSENEEKQSTEPSGWSPGDPDPPPGEKKKVVPKVASVKLASEADDMGSIKTGQVVKTVQSSAQERSAGVGMLAERLKKDPTAGDEVDRLLSRNRSPTRRRMGGTFSQATQSLKETSQRKRSDTDDSGFSEAEERSPDGGAEDEIILKKSTGPV